MVSGRTRGPQVLALSVNRWRGPLSLRHTQPLNRLGGPDAEVGQIPHHHPTLPSASTRPESRRSCRNTHIIRPSRDAVTMPTFERVGAISTTDPAGIMIVPLSSLYIPTILRRSRYFTFTGSAEQAGCHYWLSFGGSRRTVRMGLLLAWQICQVVLRGFLAGRIRAPLHD